MQTFTGMYLWDLIPFDSTHANITIIFISARSPDVPRLWVVIHYGPSEVLMPHCMSFNTSSHCPLMTSLGYLFPYALPCISRNDLVPLHYISIIEFDVKSWVWIIAKDIYHGGKLTQPYVLWHVMIMIVCRGLDCWPFFIFLQVHTDGRTDGLSCRAEELTGSDRC